MDIENLTIVISVAAEEALERIAAVRTGLSALSEKTVNEAKISVSAVNVGETISAMDMVIEKKGELSQPVNIVLNMGNTIHQVKQTADEILSYRQSAYQKDESSHQSSLNRKLSALRQYKSEQIQMVRDRCNQEIAIIEAARDREIAVYQNKIDELTALITQTSVDNRDALELRKIAALEDQLKYEKDAANRYYLQQAIAKAKEAYDNRKQIEAIQEEIAQYRESITEARESASAKITAARSARDAEISAITAVSAEQEENLRKMAGDVDSYTGSVKSSMADTEKQYDIHGNAITEIAGETAGDVTEAVRAGQMETLSYLMSLLGAYGLAGRNLGQTFADAFNKTLAQVQDRVDSLRRELTALGSSAGAYTGSYGAGQAASVTTNSLGGITQNFYTDEMTPYQARRMAEDIISSVF